jgi:fibronectin type 3 domain-containing protein
MTLPAGISNTVKAADTEYFLVVNLVGSGSVTYNGTGVYDPGDVVEIMATPAVGWQFSGWSGDLSGSAVPEYLTMDSNKTVTATFTEIPEYFLFVNLVGSGSVTYNGTGVYDPGDVVEITATPAVGWEFGGWSGDLSGSTVPEYITMDSNKTVTATFTEIILNFDFGTAASPVASGYTRVTESTIYNPTLGYGWTDTSNVGSRDRGTPDSLRRDLVFSSSDRVFNVDLANGEYTVKLTIGDNNYMHDNIDVYAEGALKVNDLTVSAGSFTQQTFGVTVYDGQLNLKFVDDGGSDVNWVINTIEITPGPPPFWRGYDFGTASSPLEPGYIRISHYKSRDREAPDNNLRRDLIFDSSDATFVPWDIPNGNYLVTVTIGDQQYRHDNIDVYAEGAIKLNDVTVEAGQFTVQTFTVTLSDGELNIRFHDDGGTDENWIVNAITIESIT